MPSVALTSATPIECPDTKYMSENRMGARIPNQCTNSEWVSEYRMDIRIPN